MDQPIEDGGGAGVPLCDSSNWLERLAKVVALPSNYLLFSSICLEEGTGLWSEPISREYLKRMLTIN